MRGKVAMNKHRGSTLDDLLAGEGVLEEFRTRAIEDVVAWQLAAAMRDRTLTKTSSPSGCDARAEAGNLTRPRHVATDTMFTYCSAHRRQ
jgi:hypothetical protein